MINGLLIHFLCVTIVFVCLFVFSVPGIFHCWFEDFLDVKKISVFFSWAVRDALYLYLLNKFLS